MAYGDPEVQHQIAVNVGINAAVELSKTTEDPIQSFFNIASNVVEHVLSVHTEHAFKAVNEAFQGTTQVAAPVVQFGPAATPAPVVAQPVQAPAPVAPMPIPGVTDGDAAQVAILQDFLTKYQQGQVAGSFQSATEGQWFDNRVGKTAKAPDFKVKGPKGDRTAPSLWINDKKNPSWAAQAFAQVGIS